MNFFILTFLCTITFTTVAMEIVVEQQSKVPSLKNLMIDYVAHNCDDNQHKKLPPELRELVQAYKNPTLANKSKVLLIAGSISTMRKQKIISLLAKNINTTLNNQAQESEPWYRKLWDPDFNMYARTYEKNLKSIDEQINEINELKPLIVRNPKENPQRPLCFRGCCFIITLLITVGGGLSAIGALVVKYAPH